MSLKILITCYDGFNVHNPYKLSDYREFETLEKAQMFRTIVEKNGWEDACRMLEEFKMMLSAEDSCTP